MDLDTQNHWGPLNRPSTTMKCKVYVAGAYSAGDSVANVATAIDAGERLLEAGFVPFVPHMNMVWHLRHQHTWEEWLDWCLSWVEVCDVILRLPGESRGADREVEWADQNRLEIYHNIEELLADQLHLERIANERYAEYQRQRRQGNLSDWGS